MTDLTERKKQIVAGAVVVLKSGGPRMTTLHRSKAIIGDWWRCGWIDEQGIFQSQELPAWALIAIEAGEPWRDRDA